MNNDLIPYDLNHRPPSMPFFRAHGITPKGLDL